MQNQLLLDTQMKTALAYHYNDVLIIFVGTDPLFCALRFMEITWLLGPGTKVLKVGQVIFLELSWYYYNIKFDMNGAYSTFKIRRVR